MVVRKMCGSLLIYKPAYVEIKMRVDWPEAEDALRCVGKTVHIATCRGWSSSAVEGEVIDVGAVRARVVRVMYKASYSDFPELWREMDTGSRPDAVTASNYGLCGFYLVKI